MNNFFFELKRRNVYKVAVAYAVVSWLLIQAASILLPTFEVPAWVMKIFDALLILCFPVALVFSWAFEITPEGIKREEDVAPNESITHHTGRKIVGITIVVAILATGLFIFQLQPVRQNPFRPALAALPAQTRSSPRTTRQDPVQGATAAEMSTHRKTAKLRITQMKR